MRATWCVCVCVYYWHFKYRASKSSTHRIYQWRNQWARYERERESSYHPTLIIRGIKILFLFFPVGAGSITRVCLPCLDLRSRGRGGGGSVRLNNGFIDNSSQTVQIGLIEINSGRVVRGGAQYIWNSHYMRKKMLSLSSHNNSSYYSQIHSVLFPLCCLLNAAKFDELEASSH